MQFVLSCIFITTVKKKDQKLPEEILTESDVFKLIEYAEHERNKAFIALLRDIGERIGEIGTLPSKIFLSMIVG